MVDLHPNSPGLDEEHRWASVGRWGMAWRVALSSLLVGMLGMMLLGLIDLSGHLATPELFSQPFVRAFAVAPAPVFGALAAGVGPWLRRFFPFTQGLFFGVAGAFSVAVLACVLMFAGTLLFGQCTPSNDCFAPQQIIGMVVLVMMFAGLPLVLMAGLGLGIAIAVSNGRRARLIFWPMLVTVAIAFVLSGVLPPR